MDIMPLKDGAGRVLIFIHVSKLRAVVPGLDSPCKTQGDESLVPAWPKAVPGSPDILLFELVLCVTLPGVGPGRIHHCWTPAGLPHEMAFHGVNLANPKGLSSPALCTLAHKSSTDLKIQSHHLRSPTPVSA